MAAYGVDMPGVQDESGSRETFGDAFAPGSGQLRWLATPKMLKAFGL